MDAAQTLLALQELDLALMRGEKQLDELPEKRAILEVRHKTADVRALREKAAELVHRHERAISAANDEVAAVDEKIAEVQAKLDSGEGVTPKELHNLSREMDALKRRKDKLENDELQTMERLDTAKAQVAKVDAALEQLAAREADLVGRFREKGGAVQSDLERHRTERAMLAGGIDSALLDRYEAARGAKGGIGAARLNGTTCSACRVELPRERVRDLHEGPDVGVCPSCRRLLVVRGFADE